MGIGLKTLLFGRNVHINASARHCCMELMHENEVQMQKSMVPNKTDNRPKLHRLDRINKLLAHRPWMIKKHHFKELTVGDNESQQKFMLNEMVASVILLAHFHAFSSFVSGCGIVNKPSGSDPTPGLNPRADDEPEPLPEGESEIEVPAIMNKMKDLQSQKEDIEMAELARRFEKVKTLDAEEIHAAGGGAGVGKRSRSTTPSSTASETIELAFEVKAIDPSKYTSDLDFQYVDFIKREEPQESPTFREQEFSWADQAFSTLSKFHGEVAAELIDEKFKIISELTYRTIGDYESVDTSLFRLAVQRYIQCLFGIRHDDYDYAQINILLPRRLKTYIKTACCYPERCTIEDYEAIMADFKNSEKVHVCLLVCEARFQAGLLYALRAFAEYYSTK